MFLGKCAYCRGGTPDANAHDFEVVAMLLGGDMGDSVRDDTGILGLGIEEKQHDSLANERRHAEASAREGTAREAGQRTLSGRARCALLDLSVTRGDELDCIGAWI